MNVFLETSRGPATSSSMAAFGPQAIVWTLPAVEAQFLINECGDAAASFKPNSAASGNEFTQKAGRRLDSDVVAVATCPVDQ